MRNPQVLLGGFVFFEKPMFHRLIWLFLLAAVTAIYIPSLSGGFLFDDIPNIVDNSAVHLAAFDYANLRNTLSGVSAGPLGRPVSVISFALTHLFFGLDPFAFKAINLAIHAINGILVGGLVALLLKNLHLAGLSDRTRTWLPIWVAAVWLIHPIHFIAISMAVQRMTLLAGTFTLLALIAHFKAMHANRASSARWWLLVGWVVFWPLAFLSKESALLFPAFAMLAAWISSQNGAGSKVSRKYLLLGGTVFVLMGAAMFLLLGWSWLQAGYAMRDFTLMERLLTQARVLWFYLAQTLLPSYSRFGLYLDWYPVSKGLLEPLTTLLALLGWGVILSLAFRYRHRWPIVAFGLMWFLVGHSLESTFVPLEIAHEHRNYLAALGPILAVSLMLVSTLSRLQLEQKEFILGVAAFAAIGVLGTITALRSVQMSDALVGSQIEATRHDASARANYIAAWSLIKAGIGDREDPIGGNNIRFYFEQAEQSDKSFKIGYLGLIVWSCGSFRLVEMQWLDSFAHKLEYTPYGHGQLALPMYLLKPLLATPDCLARDDVLRLFEAGSRNTLVRKSVRARFLEAAGDYELVVANDPRSAHEYYLKASALDGHNAILNEKRDRLQSTE